LESEPLESEPLESEPSIIENISDDNAETFVQTF